MRHTNYNHISRDYYHNNSSPLCFLLHNHDYILYHYKHYSRSVPRAMQISLGCWFEYVDSGRW